MAKTRQEKDNIVKTYEDRIKDSNALIVITPTSITPNEANELRKKLRETNSSFSVIKNTLFKVALDNKKKKFQNFDLNTENAIIFCKEDITQTAKILTEFLESVKKGEIRGGLLDGEELAVNQIKELAKLPSRDILIATTVTTIASPIKGFLNVLNGNLVNLVNVLKNLAESKEA